MSSTKRRSFETEDKKNLLKTLSKKQITLPHERASLLNPLSKSPNDGFRTFNRRNTCMASSLEFDGLLELQHEKSWPKPTSISTDSVKSIVGKNFLELISRTNLKRRRKNTWIDNTDSEIKEEKERVTKLIFSYQLREPIKKLDKRLSASSETGIFLKISDKRFSPRKSENKQNLSIKLLEDSRDNSSSDITPRNYIEITPKTQRHRANNEEWKDMGRRKKFYGAENLKDKKLPVINKNVKRKSQEYRVFVKSEI
ncbi:unnamed protein product [Blepharisma stoltei]|uniref:Uncharacterized protein n=1 Tax=Blepharisma stoltei TaxID=1481888 RepID=A0AAU9IBT5_9CILI|nr:unnamed protein product [Blepharisma stoltei]